MHIKKKNKKNMMYIATCYEVYNTKYFVINNMMAMKCVKMSQSILCVMDYSVYTTLYLDRCTTSPILCHFTFC